MFAQLMSADEEFASRVIATYISYVMLSMYGVEVNVCLVLTVPCPQL